MSINEHDKKHFLGQYVVLIWDAKAVRYTEAQVVTADSIEEALSDPETGEPRGDAALPLFHIRDLRAI